MGAGTNTSATQISVSAMEDVDLQSLSATNVVLDANNIFQQGALIATDNVDVTAANIFEVTETGAINVMDGSLTTDSGNIEINGDVAVGAGSITLNSRENTVVDASITGASLSLLSNQEIAMAANGQIDVTDSVSLDAQGDIGLTSVNANTGEVNLSTLAAVTDNNGSSVNIVADSLNISSGTGIGSAETFIETEVANLSARNTLGEANILNSGDITIHELISDGSIQLENTLGNVTLQASEGDIYDNREPEGLSPLDAGGVMNAGYQSGTMRIAIADGDLIAAPAPGADKRRPDLVGDRIEVVVSNGEFASSEGRTIVVYARTSMFISSQGGTRPVPAFGIEPIEGFQGVDDLLDSSFVSSVSDLLVDVESLQEVDPAVFTEVRNYSHDNISIRMPVDQLYGDEYEDEEEDEEFAL